MIARPRRHPSPKGFTGIFSWGQHLTAPITPPMSEVPAATGTAGGISAAVISATWAATTSTWPSGP